MSVSSQREIEIIVNRFLRPSHGKESLGDAAAKGGDYLYVAKCRHMQISLRLSNYDFDGLRGLRLQQIFDQA